MNRKTLFIIFVALIVIYLTVPVLLFTQSIISSYWKVDEKAAVVYTEIAFFQGDPTRPPGRAYRIIDYGTGKVIYVVHTPGEPSSIAISDLEHK